jgi:hypothetical protein
MYLFCFFNTLNSEYDTTYSRLVTMTLIPVGGFGNSITNKTAYCFLSATGPDEGIKSEEIQYPRIPDFNGRLLMVLTVLSIEKPNLIENLKP